MAPNALAEDYRVKWKNANDRIFDLETVVAELHAELQQVRQAAAGQANVATTTEQLTLANVHITDLENTVNERENTLQQARRELTEALSHIRLLEKSLSSGAGRGGQFGNAATSANPNAAMEVMNLRHQLEFAQNNENSLRQQMKELKADDAITSDNYRSRLASADGVEAALRKQITEWKSKTKKAESKAAKEEKWKETAQKRVKSLEASLTREKNNTKFAEAGQMSSCNSCNMRVPVRVASLDTDDEETSTLVSVKEETKPAAFMMPPPAHCYTGYGY